LFPLFATGVVDTGGKFTAIVIETGSAPVRDFSKKNLKLPKYYFQGLGEDNS